MEAAAALVSFVGLTGPAAQGLKFLYDFRTVMKDCPEDIREMKTDLELTEDLITQVIQQSNERDVRLRESVELARAISHAQKSVEVLKKELAAYLVDRKRKRFRFAAKLVRTQKLRESLDRTRTIMVEFKNQLQSDLLYEIRDMNSSQETTASSISSSRSIPPSVSQNARQANIASKHPLLQFKHNQFQFLIAIIFTQRTKNNEHLACQRASECLAEYSTPQALSKASPVALSQYFGGLGLQNAKPPQLIKLAQAYVEDPPKQGRLRSKAKCPQSEISHLPQIGPLSVNAWLVYCCERTNIVTQDSTLLDYMEHLKIEAGARCL